MQLYILSFLLVLQIPIKDNSLLLDLSHDVRGGGEKKIKTPLTNVYYLHAKRHCMNFGIQKGMARIKPALLNGHTVVARFTD